MRTTTDLPHDNLAFGQLWNGQTGNYNTSRLPIDHIILHTAVGTLQGTAAWFNNPNSKVSAHYGIDVDGKIYAFVPENCVAFQAGDYNMNQRSVGIEHIDNGDPQAPRTPEQIAASARLVAELSIAHNIPLDRQHVLKHNEVTNTQCPGNLPVDEILAKAKELLTPPAPTDEPLHTYQLKPSVFVGVVTKSTEYDEIWKDLKLDESLKGNHDSHKLILADINRRVADALNGRSQTGTVTPAQAVTPATPAQDSPSKQSVSLWRKDVSEVLSNIWSAVRGARAN